MNSDCVAAREGRQGELPSPKKKRIRPVREATLLIATTERDRGMAVYVERRSSNGIWGGLFCPPQFPSPEAALEWVRAHLGPCDGAFQALPAIHHGFTHFDLKLHPLLIECAPLAAVNEGEAPWGCRSPSRRCSSDCALRR
jgi:A/G-specific adenine glycosylase